MAEINVGSIFKSVEDQAKTLAEKMFKQYTRSPM
jgi:hypothetical protein